MGSEYLWGRNPMQDTLLQMIALGVNVADKQFKEELNTIFTIILENVVTDKEDLVYLDFKIKKTNMHFQLIGNNIISALWLSGILPKNPTAVYENNICHIADTVYTFDKRKKILIKTLKK